MLWGSRTGEPCAPGAACQTYPAVRRGQPRRSSLAAAAAPGCCCGCCCCCCSSRSSSSSSSLGAVQAVRAGSGEAAVKSRTVPPQSRRPPGDVGWPAVGWAAKVLRGSDRRRLSACRAPPPGRRQRCRRQSAGGRRRAATRAYGVRRPQRRRAAGVAVQSACGGGAHRR